MCYFGASYKQSSSILVSPLSLAFSIPKWQVNARDFCLYGIGLGTTYYVNLTYKNEDIAFDCFKVTLIMVSTNLTFDLRSH